MRKFTFGLLVTLFSVFLAANPASAESEETRPESVPDPVECTFHVFTQHTVPEHNAFLVGDAIDFAVTLSDPDDVVSSIMFNISVNQKGWSISEGNEETVTWTAPAAGEWLVSVQLYDANGQEVIPTGDCDGRITVLEMTDPAHPDHPDEVEMPEEPVESEQPPAEYNPCADVDPSDIVNVTNEDGSISAYSPDGVLCAQIMPAPPVTARTSEPAVQPAVTSTATMTELPRTGTGLVLTAIGGVTLLLSGGCALFARRFIPYARPVKR